MTIIQLWSLLTNVTVMYRWPRVTLKRQQCSETHKTEDQSWITVTTLHKNWAHHIISYVLYIKLMVLVLITLLPVFVTIRSNSAPQFWGWEGILFYKHFSHDLFFPDTSTKMYIYMFKHGDDEHREVKQ